MCFPKGFFQQNRSLVCFFFQRGLICFNVNGVLFLLSHFFIAVVFFFERGCFFCKRVFFSRKGLIFSTEFRFFCSQGFEFFICNRVCFRFQGFGVILCQRFFFSDKQVLFFSKLVFSPTNCFFCKGGFCFS